MTINEAYIRFTNLVNRNATNNNINVDKSRFVLLFNDIQNRYLEWILEKRNEDVIRYVAHLQEPNKKLTLNSKNDDRDHFNLPEDFFDHSFLRVFASKNKCKSQELKVFEAKSENVEELYPDSNEEPSFEYRETFYHFSNNNISVFKKDFNIDKVLLTYYRYPKEVDIEGYLKLDNTNSVNKDPEFDDKTTNRILLGMSREFAAINSQSPEYQLSTERLFSNI